ncbi:hypothetical protein DV451_004277 [Geotrichum candidum]|uniref:6-phosphogluconolactonase-like protein n=1 Tax=Geotrichum candidum TaxID=1173061 RepID=A0A0J9X3R4_GEOCN|nr:hypothetical protein DV451_004277 [Geotrichum candidum]KAI9212381.1 hypothetical protein DS838_002755 [Geotrichum bryndzae]KAF5108565.1 hypothetical protein DV453_002158 [Geotrichum candidum]KAF5115248.1 hypothetical protein DV454_002398 [Geotrichum candidum]KAF5120011.1 hypothetical protein DV452_001331 [Geotrichum candidum]
MTTTVPAVYAFPELSGVASAVADHVLAAQNATLFPTKSKSKSSASISNSHSSGTGTPVQQAAHQHKRFKIGLSGGSLISVLEEGLLARVDDVLWDRWDIYFADERLVPFDSPESNYGLVKRKLLDKLPADGPRPRVFHVNEKLLDDAQEAADAYEKMLISGFAAKDSVKLPMFDLLLLGCAPDGHICSLFPNHPLLREQYAWVAPVEDAPKPPPRRITLTLPVIYHAHRVTFVVEGATKTPVVKTIMERPEKGLPSSLVNEAAAGKVSWFVDNEALSGVFVTKKEYKIQVPNKKKDEESAATTPSN